MKKLSTDVKRVILPVGHQLAEEMPYAFARTILEFLQDTRWHAETWNNLIAFSRRRLLDDHASGGGV